MPPADRTARALATTVAAARRIDDWLAATAPDPEADSVLPGWDMTTLVAHLGVGLRVASRTLGQGSRTGLLSVGRYLAAYGPAAGEVADRDRALAVSLGWDGVRREYTSAIAELASLDPAAVPAKVAGPRGTLRPADFLATRAVELVVHADDLHRSVTGSSPIGFARAELTLALRSLTQALGDNHPGHTIEVRVPPYAAVQCGVPGDGPTHTRGTPPNVVETDATTFLRLATGRLGWADAVADRRVRASGHRADLSALLPLW